MYNGAARLQNAHVDTDVLPFCSLVLKGQKPPSKHYPNNINTLGDHIRKRRLDLGLLQREVAERIGLAEQTITIWERQHRKPEIRFIARIIEFLGYSPFEEPESFPEKLKTYRVRMGLSQRRFAATFGIDPATVAQWETSRQKPGKLNRKLLSQIFSGMCE